MRDKIQAIFSSMPGMVSEKGVVLVMFTVKLLSASSRPIDMSLKNKPPHVEIALDAIGPLHEAGIGHLDPHGYVGGRCADAQRAIAQEGIDVQQALHGRQPIEIEKGVYARNSALSGLYPDYTTGGSCSWAQFNVPDRASSPSSRSPGTWRRRHVRPSVRTCRSCNGSLYILRDPGWRPPRPRNGCFHSG